MDDLISKASVCEVLADIYPTDGEKVVAVKEIDKAYEAILHLPSAQPEITDERAILHLHSTGWMQNHDREMYEGELRKQLEYNSGGHDSLIPCEDTISRQAAIDAICKACQYDKDDYTDCSDREPSSTFCDYMNALRSVPSAQTEIIRCNACRHWHQTTGKTKGFGLGDCDYLEKKLVTCSGYCYWAERRTDDYK